MKKFVSGVRCSHVAKALCRAVREGKKWDGGCGRRSGTRKSLEDKTREEAARGAVSFVALLFFLSSLFHTFHPPDLRAATFPDSIMPRKELLDSKRPSAKRPKRQAQVDDDADNATTTHDAAAAATTAAAAAAAAAAANSDEDDAIATPRDLRSRKTKGGAEKKGRRRKEKRSAVDKKEGDAAAASSSAAAPVSANAHAAAAALASGVSMMVWLLAARYGARKGEGERERERESGCVCVCQCEREREIVFKRF